MAVLRDSAAFLGYLYLQIADVTDLAPEVREEIQSVQRQVELRVQILVDEVLSQDYDHDLHEHSLGNGDPGWSLKYRGYVAARRQHEDRARASNVGGQPGLRRYLKWAKRPLQWLNVILGSLADVIPGAGGAYKELKESTEAVVDDVVEEE